MSFYGNIIQRLGFTAFSFKNNKKDLIVMSPSCDDDNFTIEAENPWIEFQEGKDDHTVKITHGPASNEKENSRSIVTLKIDNPDISSQEEGSIITLEAFPCDEKGHINFDSKAINTEKINLNIKSEKNERNQTNTKIVKLNKRLDILQNKIEEEPDQPVTKIVSDTIEKDVSDAVILATSNVNDIFNKERQSVSFNHNIDPSNNILILSFKITPSSI